MRAAKTLLGMLLALTVWASEGPSPVFEREKQPGVLRISGIGANDRVLVDGELVGDGRRIHQFGGRILMNPGEYTVTFIGAGDKVTCQSRILVPENGAAVARCQSPSGPRDQDVD